MPARDKKFELRQLLKAYRKGLISDELFEEQMQEIELGAAAPAVPETPARVYRVRDKTYPSERAMLTHFLDEFRAGEAFGGIVFSLWTKVATDPTIRGGIRAIAEREAMHGRILSARLSEIGAECSASLPDSFQEAARAQLGSSEVSDADKVRGFLTQIPDAEKAVAPIREVIDQIEEDLETRSLLATILEDELATIRWFQSVGSELDREATAAPSPGDSPIS